MYLQLREKHNITTVCAALCGDLQHSCECHCSGIGAAATQTKHECACACRSYPAATVDGKIQRGEGISTNSSSSSSSGGG